MMTNTDLQQALSGMAPKTKAARLRVVLPLIEQKIAEGVRIADMLATLHDAGIAISLATLKSYLYRHRKKQVAQAAAQPAAPRARSGAARANDDLVPVPAAAPGAAMSMQALDRLMKPDPARQAEELAHYERLARQQTRKGPTR